MRDPFSVWRSAVMAMVLAGWALVGICRAEDKDILPKGFDVARYQKLWERNPFTLVTPSVAQAAPSIFSKLVLLSWLQDKDKDIVFVQDTETNEVKKVTKNASDNPDGLRLISVNANQNPSLIEAKLTNGKEEGVVKFRAEPAHVNQVANLNTPVLPGQNPSMPNGQLRPRNGFNPNGQGRPQIPGQALNPPNQNQNNPVGPPTPEQVRRRRTLATPVPTQAPVEQNEGAESNDDS